MNKSTTNLLELVRCTLTLATVAFASAWIAPVATGQETGGELGGGAGIFRPKNPEAKRTGTVPRSPRLSAAEIEARFVDAIADGNDARDARKFAAAEASYRSALRLKPRDARANYGLGNVFVDQQRWEDAETSYRAARDTSVNNAEILMALSFVLVQPRTGGMNAQRFTEA